MREPLFDPASAFLPHLKNAIERYEDAVNWSTIAALRTACAAVYGEDWATHELLNNPAWSLDE